MIECKFEDYCIGMRLTVNPKDKPLFDKNCTNCNSFDPKSGLINAPCSIMGEYRYYIRCFNTKFIKDPNYRLFSCDLWSKVYSFPHNPYTGQISEGTTGTFKIYMYAPNLSVSIILDISNIIPHINDIAKDYILNTIRDNINIKLGHAHVKIFFTLESNRCNSIGYTLSKLDKTVTIGNILQQLIDTCDLE